VSRSTRLDRSWVSVLAQHREFVGDVGERDPDTAAAVRLSLPDAMDPLCTAEPGPTALTRTEADRVLERLPGWTGDDRRLRLGISPLPGREYDVRDGIARAELDLTHHAPAGQGPDGVTSVLPTRAVGVVTDLGVQLALRIDDVLEGSERSA
jgi:hypothetical protein